MNSLEIRPLTFGLLGVAIITLRWFRLRKQIPRWTLAPAAVCVIYFFFRAWMFGRGYAPSWYTYDNFLYYADQSFGFNPSLLANHWIERLHWFGFISIVYESLMLAIACTYAYSLGRRGQPLRVMVLMILAGVIGSQAYRIMPACGPVYLLGSPCYLGQEAASCAAISAADLHPVGINPVAPRNAIPSMHVAWGLLVYWVWRSSRWRWPTLGYLLLTIVSTLGGGEHYLVDVIAAFPFALALWAACSAEWNFARALTLALSTLAFLGWMAILHFNPELLHSSVIVPWLLAALLMAGSSEAARRLEITAEPVALRS